jgi:2-iminobutanoate/2-iminopropanoate deaminase
MSKIRIVAVAAACWVAFSTGAASQQDRRFVPATPPAAYSAAVTAGGLVYVSGVVGTAGSTGASAGADIAAQTAGAFARLKAELESAGALLDTAVNVNVYLKRASDFDAMNVVYRRMFAADPPARTTIQADLPGDSLIELSAIAVPAGAKRQAMLPEGWMKSPRPYSYVIATDDLVFLSGLVSRRGIDDKVVPGSVAVQTRTILNNAQTLLRTAGLELDDVVAARVFLTDDSHFDEMNEEYKKFFDVDSPARATTVAALMGADATVEISLIASREEKQVIGAPMQPTLPISAAIRAGRRVFFSGVVGTTDTNVADTPAQTREALARLKTTMAAAGMSYADIVDSTVYLNHLWQTDQIDKVYREIFPTDPPARTVAGAGFVSRGAAVELLFTGYK